MPHLGATFKATGIAVNYFQRLQSSLARGVPTSISLLLSLSFSAWLLGRSKQRRKQDSITFRLIRSRFLCVRERERKREGYRDRHTNDLLSRPRVTLSSAISLTSLVTADNIV